MRIAGILECANGKGHRGLVKQSMALHRRRGPTEADALPLS